MREMKAMKWEIMISQTLKVLTVRPIDMISLTLKVLTVRPIDM
jgi:hypothetical protein